MLPSLVLKVSCPTEGSPMSSDMNCRYSWLSIHLELRYFPLSPLKATCLGSINSDSQSITEKTSFWSGSGATHPAYIQELNASPVLCTVA
ncbi:hypothetical protein LguiA_007140 [Lonicera macranthoides]